MDNIKDFVLSMDGSRDNLFMAICLKEGKRHIGNIKIGPINWLNRFTDIRLLIGEKDCWGKGYASEAIGLVVDIAFNKLGLHKLWAGAYDANQGSVKSFIKNRFSIEGRSVKKLQQWFLL